MADKFILGAAELPNVLHLVFPPDTGYPIQLQWEAELGKDKPAAAAAAAAAAATVAAGTWPTSPPRGGAH